MIPREIKALSLSFFILFVAYNGVQQFLTSYFSDLGMMRAGFWSLILIYFSLLVSNFFSGFIVSKFGAKKCLIFGSLFYSLFIFALAAGNLLFVYIASILLGFGGAILWAAQGVFLIRASDSDNYGENSGFFSTFFQLGSVVGILAFSLIVTKIHFNNSFLIFGFLPLISAAIFFAFKDAKPNNFNLREKIAILKKLITNQTILKFSLIWLSFSFVLASVAGQIPLEIKKYFGLNSIGIISPIFYFLPIVFAYFFGKMSDIKGRKVFLILAFILVLLGFLLFIIQIKFDLNRIVFIISFLLVSFGYAVFAPIRYALLGDISSDSNLEHLSALSTMFGNAGYVLVLLLNIYFPAIVVYLISFSAVLLSLIIVLPVLRLNMEDIRSRIS